MTTERLVTEYTADTRNFRRGAQFYDRTLARQDRLTNTRLNRIDARWERSTRNILATRTALSGLTGLVGGAALVQLRNYAEGWRDLERRLVSIGETSEEAQRALVALSLRTRSSIRGTAQAVQRLSKSTGDDFETTTRRVETLQKLLASAGSSGSERASVSIQLGQALQSGVLSGDEFRSIRENSPVEFLDALAEAAGITREELKAFSEDQKLTTDVVLRALDSLATTADEKFGALAVSGEEAFNVLATGLTAYAGNVDEALGVTENINGALVFLGEYLSEASGGAETLARAIEIAAVAALTFAGTRGVGAMTRALQTANRERTRAVNLLKQDTQAARANLAQRRLEKAAADERLRLARTEINLRAEQGRVRKRDREELRRATNAQARAASVLTGAQTRALASTRALTAAQLQLNAAYRAGVIAGRAFRSIMAFFGGPIGLAFTAIATTLAVMATRTSELERLTRSTTERVDELRTAYIEAGGAVDRLRNNLGSISLAQAIVQARELDKLLTQARETVAFEISKPYIERISQNFPGLEALIAQLIDGSIRADEFRNGLNALTEQYGETFANVVTNLINPLLEGLLQATENSEQAADILLVLRGNADDAAEAAKRLGLELDNPDMSNDIKTAADEAGRLAENLAAARAERFDEITGDNPDFFDPRNEAGNSGIIFRPRPVPPQNRPGYTPPSSGNRQSDLAKHERDLATARELLVENGQKALFIEQELNAERDRLRALLPELIELGLSRAEAEAVINAELERTEARLKKVKTESERAAEALAKGVLSNVRNANSLTDAIGGIAERLRALALDRSFDILAEQLAKLKIFSSDSGLSGFLGNIFGNIFPVQASEGGHIRGPGTATSDSIPARLSDGEFVVRAKSVTPQTLPFLHAINSGTTVPQFSEGGLVNGSNPRAAFNMPSMNVAIHNHANNARVETQQSADGRELQIFILETVSEGIFSGRLDRSFKSVFGLRRKARGV